MVLDYTCDIYSVMYKCSYKAERKKVIMTNSERRDRGMAYISDDGVMEEQKVCRRILQELNTVDRADFSKISQLVKKLLGKSEGAYINPPLYCDYGTHIEV